MRATGKCNGGVCQQKCPQGHCLATLMCTQRINGDPCATCPKNQNCHILGRDHGQV